MTPQGHEEEILAEEQEESMVELFHGHVIFYDQQRKDFKNSPKRCKFLKDRAKELNMNGEFATFFFIYFLKL